MRILIADDDELCRLELATLLARHGHDVSAVADGVEAWDILQQTNPPRLVILDWLMNDLDGIDVCRRLRERPGLLDVYVILLTSRGDKRHVLEGLQAGANDYVTKPFDPDELLARVAVGGQLIGLQVELAERVRELEEALSRVKLLQGLLPICCYCKNIRDDQNYWHQVESFVRSHSEAQFSHSICPTCWETQVKPQFLEHGLKEPSHYPNGTARPV
jgi:CheY-like chemotaxis protein